MKETKTVIKVLFLFVKMIKKENVSCVKQRKIWREKEMEDVIISASLVYLICSL